MHQHKPHFLCARNGQVHPHLLLESCGSEKGRNLVPFASWCCFLHLKIMLPWLFNDQNMENLPGCLKSPFILPHADRYSFPYQEWLQLLCFNLLIILQEEVAHGCSSVWNNTYDVDLVLIFNSNAVNRCCIVVDDWPALIKSSRGPYSFFFRVVSQASIKAWWHTCPVKLWVAQTKVQNYIKEWWKNVRNLNISDSQFSSI